MSKAMTLKAIAPLQLAYGKELDDTRLDFYVEMLKDIPPDFLSVAVKKLIQTAVFLPSIAEIRKAAQMATKLASGTNEMDADEAWGRVQRAIMSVGQYSKPDFNDELLNAVVNNLGWRDICQTPVDETHVLRAQFRKAYERALTRKQEMHDFETAGVTICLKGAPDVNLLSERMKL